MIKYKMEISRVRDDLEQKLFLKIFSVRVVPDLPKGGSPEVLCLPVLDNSDVGTVCFYYHFLFIR